MSSDADGELELEQFVDDEMIKQALQEAERLGLISSFIGVDGITRYLLTPVGIDYVTQVLAEDKRGH